MTVVGALQTTDGFLLAADGQFILDEEVNVPGTKVFVWKRDDKIIWAFSGAQPVAQQFQTWLDSQEFATWGELADAASGHLASLNGNAVRSARVSETETEAVEVLMAGYLADEGRLLYLDREGQHMTVSNKVLFIGGGAGQAYMCWYTAERLVGDAELYTLATLETALEVAIERTPRLGLPLTVLSVTA